MLLRSLALSAALCVVGASFATGAASAADLAVSPVHRHYHHHRVAEVDTYRTAYVFWDDVYPPAIYGPTVRPVEEIAELKANRLPVDAHWRGYWYLR